MDAPCGMREPKWHKPRTALAAACGFGAFVVAGAVVHREPQMVLFGGLSAGYGLTLYGADVLLTRWRMGGRPAEVWMADLWWAAACVGTGVGFGLASPLYVG